MATDTDLIRRMDKMEKALMEAASKPASRGGVSPNIVFGGGSSPYSQHSAEQWPIDKLKALGGMYGTPQAVDLYCRKNGKIKLSGMGPALLKLAAISSGNPDAIASARAQGVPDNYDEKAFEAEYGFTSTQKAAKVGVPGYDYATGKVLLNERRKTALAEGSGQTGGYIVPPQFMNELLTIAAEDGFIEQRAKVLPMTSRTAQWPMLDITTVQSTGTSPYFGGILATWQPEATTISETDPIFRQSEWTAWDLVLYTVSSNQLLADNGIGLDALLTQLFGQAIVWYKEYAYLQGKGAGSTMPLGIINAPATLLQTRSVAGRFTLADAAAMLAHLQIRSWDDACWIMHQSVIPQLIQMVDNASSNRLVWLSPMGNGTSMGPAAMKLPTAFLNGLPIYFTEKLPSLGTKGDVMLVDWSKYVIGMRMDYQVDVSPHYLFRNNQLAWRVVARADGKPWLNSYITDSSGWQISPFVVLN
jgi:HK97 family phage major capsid protein